MASFVFELFPVGGQLKERGLRGPRLGPTVVSGHQSERHGVCPSPKPRLISWRNNAGQGGPSLDAEYELGGFVLLDWELHGVNGISDPPSLSLFRSPSTISLPYIFESQTPLSWPSSPSLNRFFSTGPQRGQTCQCCWAPRQICLGFSWGLVQDPSPLADHHPSEAAMSVWAHTSSCSHGPTEHWAVPLLGDRASERAEDMLGRRPGDHCTEFCYFTNYCSNHGNATEGWSGLHCHRHHGCHRGRRRSEKWVLPVARWAQAIMFLALRFSTHHGLLWAVSSSLAIVKL